MLRVVEKFVRFVFLNYFAKIHKDDAVGDGLGKPHFVGDHDHRHAFLGPDRP